MLCIQYKQITMCVHLLYFTLLEVFESLTLVIKRSLLGAIYAKVLSHNIVVFHVCVWVCMKHVTN